MKAISLIKIVAVFTVFATATACKKDYICTCKKTYTSSNGTTVSNSDGNYTFTDSKVRASGRCQDLETTGSDLYGEYTRECEIE
ncbi:MAG: hypothetical protein IT234_01265 [Bacteroidia bacterium]|nr:hypothetical protein [Bacteroidia bacterium]